MLGKRIIFVISILLFVNCKSKRVFEEINFENNYKFNSEIQQKLAKDTVSWKHQLSAGEYAIKGDYKNALVQWDLAFSGEPGVFSQKQIDSINSKYKVVSALNYISEQAKSTQVVIINESHNNSSHRVFTKSLLQNLYNNGYRNLGLEALSNGVKMDSLLNVRKYPIQESGYYIKDPQFGNLVRAALEIGFYVFPYEQTSNVNGKEREIKQAKNIKNVMDQKPGEKFIIHCGFDHVLEGNHKKWEKAMAERLYEFTGINPLTINQTKFSERSEPKFNNPLLKALDIQEPAVLLDQNDKPFQYKRLEAFTDIAVLHSTTKYENDRPSWLFDSEKRNVKIELKDLKVSFPVMVMAYYENEDIDSAIPTDIIEIHDKNSKGYLALKKGNYNILIDNKAEGTLKFELKID